MRRRSKEPSQAIETNSDRLERHQRRCQVCRHPEREVIEEEFVNWREVYHLARDYEIQDYRSIYRHATATGLIHTRRANMRWALDMILEEGPGNVNADSVIRAIRAYSCLDENNKWTEPPTQVIFSVAGDRIPPSARSRLGRSLRALPDHICNDAAFQPAALPPISEGAEEPEEIGEPLTPPVEVIAPAQPKRRRRSRRSAPPPPDLTEAAPFTASPTVTDFLSTVALARREASSDEPDSVETPEASPGPAPKPPESNPEPHEPSADSAREAQYAPRIRFATREPFIWRR